MADDVAVTQLGDADVHAIANQDGELGGEADRSHDENHAGRGDEGHGQEEVHEHREGCQVGSHDDEFHVSSNCEHR